MRKDSHCELSLPDEWQKEDFTAYIALENEERMCVSNSNIYGTEGVSKKNWWISRR